MNGFINLTAQKSKDIDCIIYKNARQLRKDALLIVEVNKSYSSATSLLILSSEEVIKAILVLLLTIPVKVNTLFRSKVNSYFDDNFLG